MGKLLCCVLEVGYIYLMIFWGFLGIGKIILVEVVVNYVNVEVECVLVVMFGVKEICVVIEKVCENKFSGWCIILFVDEVYCFNKL